MMKAKEVNISGETFTVGEGNITNLEVELSNVALVVITQVIDGVEVKHNCITGVDNVHVFDLELPTAPVEATKLNKDEAFEQGVEAAKNEDYQASLQESFQQGYASIKAEVN